MTTLGYWVESNSTSTSLTGSSGTNIVFTRAIEHETPAGSVVQVKSKPKGEFGVKPQHYFRFIKSKLTVMEQDKLQRRLTNLKLMVVDAQDLDQRALYEKLCEVLAVVVRESEAVACGIDTWIDKKTIEKFRLKVVGKVVKFESFDKFPRLVPKAPKAKIAAAMRKNLFDEYWILYVDYTGDKQEELKTNKEKIRNKDPIVFGRYLYQPDRYYAIADWVDEHCDITLDKIVDVLSKDDPTFALTDVPDLDRAEIEKIKAEVLARTKRLQDTNSSNYKKLMEDEDKAYQERKERLKLPEPQKDLPPPQTAKVKPKGIVERWFGKKENA